MGKKKLIKKDKAPLISNLDLEDWIDDLKTCLYKGTPSFNEGAGPSNPPLINLNHHIFLLKAHRLMVHHRRDEIHFFDGNTFKFSVFPEPSPIPFKHWKISENETNFDWEEYEDCTEAVKKRCRKEQGKLFCVGYLLYAQMKKFNGI